MPSPEGADAVAAGVVPRLVGSGYRAYLYQPIPSPADNDVREAIEAYLAARRADRARIEEHIVGEPADVLETFAQRQAVVAVRMASVKPIRLGLVALGMAIPHGERTEVLMALSKLDHSAQVLGIDLADVASKAARDLPEEARSFVAKFLARHDRKSLLAQLGFAAYGQGPDFVYDNISPSGDGAPPVSPAGGFVMRQYGTKWNPVAIRVADDTLILTDRLARRFTFPLHSPNPPERVVSYRTYYGRGGPRDYWAVVDASGKAVVSDTDTGWNPEDFKRLAAAGGFRLEPVPDEPPQRNDFVDFTAPRMSTWLAFPLMLLVPILVVAGFVGLWDGYAWLWPAVWLGTGGYFLIRSLLDDPVIEANLAALPPDERPAEPRPKANRGRSAAIVGAIALVPPFVVYLVHSAPQRS